ncbi:RmlC-like cupin domain-containing protein [Tricladium varicosporioides]|nr:RmlC-like cupin domain-containing protein [Hymenoscyphus varicosporioides]
MVDIALIKANEGEILKMGPVTIRILEDGSKTDNRIGSMMLTIAPNTPGPAIHWHRMHDETFLVTKGKFQFTTDKGTHEANVGDYVVVPPKAIHTFGNPYDEPAEFFNTFTPAYYVDYLRMLSKEMLKIKEDGGNFKDFGEDKQRAIMAQFATFPPGDLGYMD